MTNRAARPLAIFRVTLLALAVLIPTLAGAYGFMNRDRLFPRTDAVVVYGRESCGITRMVRAGLAERSIPYTFANIDIRAIDDELSFKLGPDFKEPRITLPVVHVAGRVLLTPTAEQVQEALAQRASPPRRDYSTFLRGADPVPHY